MKEIVQPNMENAGQAFTTVPDIELRNPLDGAEAEKKALLAGLLIGLIEESSVDSSSGGDVTQPQEPRSIEEFNQEIELGFSELREMIERITNYDS
jgi:hypothetical protein